MTSEPQKGKTQFLQIRIQLNRSSRLGLACEYLSQHNLNQNDEVKQFLEAGFYPLAMSVQGKLTREIAAECIGKLRGYIYAIEQLAGLESMPAPLPRHQERDDRDDFEEEMVEEVLPKPPFDIDGIYKLKG
ncbi:hypothetical protein NDI45_25285 [Leptolyngbya sp. GB1-A1]|uniref:hypothetical protein n=1 Tax=Leptolyngbya sp. GB1-A1 TaxID=2933908 RepID=UPI0032979BA8